ncbi:MAG TPA: epoxyqueuosine reductase QueH [Feifaniaceae bacterium]|nr:epoxyqueuosine reductase QueH [Feifaniaceae bacterium]
MKTLLHACCAPCSIECVETLRREGIEPTLYWYNPNIHPFTEYRSRKEALVSYAQSSALAYVLRDEYGLRPFLNAVPPERDRRCARCYEMRLEETARYAAEHGYEQFSTTLLISPYQNHDLLRETGDHMAQKYCVAFLYRDFRPHFRDGQQKARDFGLYMQKYCGCIFSEEERYRKKAK